MKIAGLMFVRNGQPFLKQALDAMAEYCDFICVINDRSRDGTKDILSRHPSVSSVVYLSGSISDEDWFFSEGLHLNSLYRLVDYYAPDWVIQVGVDTVVWPGGRELRKVLGACGPGVVGLTTPQVSVWRDLEYPLLVPLMGLARTLKCKIWKYFPGLVASSKRLHNVTRPVGLERFGEIRAHRRHHFLPPRMGHPGTPTRKSRSVHEARSVRRTE